MGVNIEDIILHKGRPARQDVGLVAAMSAEEVPMTSIQALGLQNDLLPA